MPARDRDARLPASRTPPPMLITDALVARQVALHGAAARDALRECWAARLRARAPRRVADRLPRRPAVPPGGEAADRARMLGTHAAPRDR